VILDFDLTLVDSTKAAADCVRSALTRLGYDTLTPEAVRGTIGLNLEATLQSLTGETRPEVQSRFRDLFIERADQVMVARTELMDGVASALGRLREAGARLAIVSTKYRYRIEAILRRFGLESHFETIIGGEDTGVHKPDPEGLVFALEALGLVAPETVYVGDHVVDAEAAMRARIPFVGVLSGTSSPADFQRYPHVAVLNGVEELPQLLAGMEQWPPPAFGMAQPGAAWMSHGSGTR
jgi:phosphoglycolate phosphatase